MSLFPFHVTCHHYDKEKYLYTAIERSGLLIRCSKRNDAQKHYAKKKKAVYERPHIHLYEFLEKKSVGITN